MKAPVNHSNYTAFYSAISIFLTNNQKADTSTFCNLALAFEALKEGGNMPCILNAANEVAVAAFLQDKLGFLQMSDIIETCMAKIAFVEKPNYSDYVQTDEETRRFAFELITKKV